MLTFYEHDLLNEIIWNNNTIEWVIGKVVRKNKIGKKKEGISLTSLEMLLIYQVSVFCR